MEQGYEVVSSGKNLALRITAPGRTKPAVVISWHPEQEQNRIDVSGIVREVRGLADVFWLENGPESYAFGDHLPAGAHVFGNAARVYSADLRWMQDVFQSPLRQARDRPAAARAAEDVIEDVLSLITVVPPKATPARSAGRRVRGTIKAFASAGSRAIVELPDGSCCSIQRERVVPPVRLDWMLSLGQSVEGELNDEDKTLDINRLKSVPRLAELYRSGDLVLALAEQVSANSAKLTLYPGSSWAVAAARISSNPLDTADSLVTEGEVVVARFLRERGAVVLSLLDVDDGAEVQPAPALLMGGTPWLQAGRHLAEQSTAGRTFPAASIGHPGGAGTPDPGSTAADSLPLPAKPSTALRSALLQLESGRRKIAGLQELVSATSRAGAGLVRLQQEHDELKLLLEAERELAGALHAELETERGRVAKHREDLRRLRTRNRESQQALQRAAADSDGLFVTSDDRLRHDVYLSWARNTLPTDKARQPLPREWAAGPGFAASLYAFTEPGVVAKALKAAVGILTGTAERTATRSTAREIHPLRENAGGDAPQLRREDGAKCFRAAIEQNVPAARRLHFWKLPDGTIELSRVVVHDDCKP
ncbi:hypothetical protein [Arthrobacter sp. UYCu723]